MLSVGQNLRQKMFPLLFKCNTNHKNNPTALEVVFIYLKLRSHTKENLHCLLPRNLHHKKKKLQKSSAFSHPNPKSRRSFHSFRKKSCHFPGFSPHGYHCHFHFHCPSRELRHGHQVPSLQKLSTTNKLGLTNLVVEPTNINLDHKTPGGGLSWGIPKTKRWNKNSVNWSPKIQNPHLQLAIFLAFLDCQGSRHCWGWSKSNCFSSSRSSAQLRGSTILYLSRWLEIYMYICIYVYMYICIYVYMYICIYVYIHILERVIMFQKRI